MQCLSSVCKLRMSTIAAMCMPKAPIDGNDILKCCHMLGKQGTQTNFKNELLFQHFQINYNDLPQRFRKVLLAEQRHSP